MAVSMPELRRLAKRVVELTGCSRREAEELVEGGWVQVDGQVIDQPQFMVSEQQVAVDPQAQLAPAEPATLLLHRSSTADDAGVSARLFDEATRWAGDETGIRPLKRHFLRLSVVLPLDPAASGLQVLTQDGRLASRMREDSPRIEQEYIVEVEGQIAAYGLNRLCHGMSFNGRELSPAKVSWQNEIRLRFAIKDVQPGQLQAMCAEVGLDVLSLRRIRIGRIPLAKMAVGEWRYLPTSERF